MSGCKDEFCPSKPGGQGSAISQCLAVDMLGIIAERLKITQQASHLAARLGAHLGVFGRHAIVFGLGARTI